jgi:ABC-type transport system involved in multi-copper enzyme maturation permease subunit
MLAGLFSDDFPERLDPMAVKEFRQRFRARQFVLPFVAIQILMLGVALLEWWDLSDGEADLEIFSEASRRFASTFWGGVAFMLMLVIPFSRFFDMQQEFNGRNAELLLLSGVDRWRIVRGKWMVSMLISLLVLVSVLPYLILRYFFGGMEWGPNLVVGTGVIVNGGVMSALVIGASAFANPFARIGMLVGGVLVSSLCVSVPVIATAGMLDQAGTGWFFLAMLAGNALAASVLLCILGLQMARVRLRAYEDPLDPAPGSQVVVLYLFTPVLIGLPAMMCGLPGIASSILFSWIALMIDPPPKANERAHYAQS